MREKHKDKTEKRDQEAANEEQSVDEKINTENANKAFEDEIIELNSKLKEAIEKQNEYENSIAELTNQNLRLMAEFQNYKKRNEADLRKIIEYAGESLLKKLLPVYNDFERALSHASESSKIEELTEGLSLIYNNFTKTLTEEGLKKMDVVGKEFDFNFHEALLQEVSDVVPPHTIIRELEPGYLYKEKVLKFAKVIVSKGPEQE